MKSFALAALACCAVVPLTASADVVLPTGPYAGAGVGDAKFSSGGFSEHATAWRAIAGYQLTPNWGLEGSYLKPETISASVGTASATQKTSAFTAQVIGNIKFGGPWQGVATVGATFWQNDISARNGTATASLSEDGIDLVYGGGVAIQVGRAWLRGMYEHAELGEGSVGLFSASVVFRF